MLDGNDRTELSALEKAREEYLEKHGSFLYCEKRDALCVHMDGMWMSGCERQNCILDDPEYIKLQERIEENRRRKRREKEDSAAPIRNQKNMIKSHEKRMMDRIRELEKESERAFRDNNPRQGETLFNRAMIMRGELKSYLERKSTQ